jgi:hypothetical protein
LKKRVKSETKAAMREVKKDNYFLENQRVNQRKEEAADRKQKFNQIMHDLQTQQHESTVSKKPKKPRRK